VFIEVCGLSKLREVGCKEIPALIARQIHGRMVGRDRRARRNGIVPIVATACGPSPFANMSAEVDRPQADGYNIC